MQEKLEAKQLILKTRYTDLSTFTVIIRRLFSTATDIQIQNLFNVIGEYKTFSETSVFVLDLWTFLAVLKEANDEGRRSFDFKTSRISGDIEFWNRRGENLSTCSPQKPLRYQKRTYTAKVLKSKDTIEVPVRRAPRESSLSVAEALGGTTSDNLSIITGGRNVLGTFKRELQSQKTTILHTPIKTRNANTQQSNSDLLFDEKGQIVPLGRHSIEMPFHPSYLEMFMREGSGASHAIYGRSISPSKKVINDRRATSKGELFKEGDNKTSVASALGYKNDNSNKSSVRSNGDNGQDHRRKISNIF